MNNVLKIIAICASLLASPYTHAVSGSPVPSIGTFSDYAGIWQDRDNPSHYYSIHYNTTENTFVLVDLSGIEATHETLKSSYMGGVSEVTGGTLSGNLALLSNTITGLYFKFNSDYTGSLSPICGPTASCAAYIIFIKKIF